MTIYGRSDELVSRCVECDLAEPESLASLGGSAPGVVDGILSGIRWAEGIHGILRDMKFLPSKADPCIWLRKAPNLRCYEYIAVYVDDLCIAAESPSAIIQIFKSKYHLKVKGDGKLTYHLGADYFEDPDGTFVSQPKKYIDKLADTYKRLFNEDPPKGYKTPLDKNDHP